MKKILLVSLITFASLAHAAPNVWQSSYAQGFIEYSIQDTKGNTLWVVCNEDAGDDYDHSANLQTKKNRYQNTDSKYPLSFLLDGKTSVAPAGSTKWRNGANAWYDFSHGIAKAKKIDVFINNKKITTFTPNSHSIKTVAKDIASCEAMF
ncbi:hypothetical protein [Acinetobacter baumannii]|uniref:hypothetical protein n=1 Tax=Acinetobacter baumannii TaxID=470 RepID=UPI0010204408|nr:hypothetical protein [Acinetobacter baumannii]RYL12988.1 hypothetical protein EWO92_20265 [Acinetobacter baumannii]RYL30554.1 hypothetical protein EWO96_10435 [Acinetobacter baumannii]RYL41100.1 hypothetical protein EWP49_20260 [Acinetobacter baumannii]